MNSVVLVRLVPVVIAGALVAVLLRKELGRFGPLLALLEWLGLTVALASVPVLGWWGLPVVPVAVLVTIAVRHVVIMGRLLDARVEPRALSPLPVSPAVAALTAQGFVVAAAVDLVPRQAPPMAALLLVDQPWATYAHISDPATEHPLVSLHTLLPAGRIVTTSRSLPTGPTNLLQAVPDAEIHEQVAAHRRAVLWAREHGAPVQAAAPEHAVAEYVADLADDAAWMGSLGTFGVVRTLLPADATLPLQERPGAVDELHRLSSGSTER